MLCWLLHEFGGLMHVWMIFFCILLWFPRLHPFFPSQHPQAVERFRSASYADGGGSPDDVGEFWKKTRGNRKPRWKGVSCRGTSPKPLRVFFCFFISKSPRKTLVDGSEVYLPKANSPRMFKKNTLVQMMVDKPTNLNGLGRLFGDRSCAAGAYGAQPGIVGGLDAEGLSSGRWTTRSIHTRLMACKRGEAPKIIKVEIDRLSMEW